MEVGGVNEIKIPDERFLSIEEADFEDKGMLHKKGHFCQVKLVRYNECDYALKIIYKDRIP